MISKQLNYLVNKEPGFYSEQLVVLQRLSTVGKDRVETFKQEIAKISGVISSTSSTMVPGRVNNYNGFMMEGRPLDQTFLLEVNGADQDFPATYGLSLQMIHPFSIFSWMMILLPDHIRITERPADALRYE